MQSRWRRSADSDGFRMLRIVLWCNGSTAVFGSACPGSNPGKTTRLKAVRPRSGCARLAFFMEFR